MTTGRPRDTIDRPEKAIDRQDDRREIWGIKLTSRNIVAFVFLPVSVVTFLMVGWVDFAE